MTSAALLLITLVMYRGQLVWLAMVIALFTASASTWATQEVAAGQGHPRHPQKPQTQKTDSDEAFPCSEPEKAQCHHSN